MNKNYSNKAKSWFLSVLLKSRKLSSQSERGYILVIVLSIVLGMTALIALYAKSSQVEKLNTKASTDINTGFYAAEAGLNLRAEEIRKEFINYGQPKGEPPSSAKACLDKDPSNDGDEDLKCINYTNFTSATTNDNAYFATTYVVEKNNGQPVAGTVAKGDQFQGLNMLEYGHSLYSLAFKKDLYSKPAAILQMDVKTRLIPMFQFAAFYTEDLEILPGPNMTLSGPVHTNGNLYLGSDNQLKINGQVTVVGDIYNKRKNNNTTYADGRVQIIDVLGTTFLNLLKNGTGSTTPTTNPMDPKRLSTAWGTQVLVNTNSPLSIPKPDILNKEGDYYDKADIRIDFKPSATSSSNMDYLDNVPFSLSAIHRTDGSTGKEMVTPVEQNFTEGQLRSLRQPIMVKDDLANIPAGTYKLCTPLAYPTDGYSSIVAYKTTVNVYFNTWWGGLTDQERRYLATSAQKALIYAIQAQKEPINLSLVRSKNDSSESITKLNSFYSNFTTDFQTALNSLYQQVSGTTINSNYPSYLSKLTPAQIAGLTYKDASGNLVKGRCFVSAPILEVITLAINLLFVITMKEKGEIYDYCS
jgi:Tfp pilus assembly protein PilX